MQVDAYISSAIDQYILANQMTQAAFAKQLGISEATMVKWRRQGNGITERRWAELFKYIKRYLPQERLFLASNGEEQYSSVNAGKGSYFEPQYIPQLVPLITDEQLRKYNMVQSIEQFVGDRNITRVEYRPAVAGYGGMFCYELTQAAAGVPRGARLFVSSEGKPRNGCMALAVLANGGEVVLGIYTNSGSTFSLSGNKSITGNISAAFTMFSVLCPVVKYEVVTI